MFVEFKVNALSLPKGIIFAEMIFPTTSEEMRFLYPKWMPGTHAPSGPIQNIGELRFCSLDNQEIPWVRDFNDPYCFVCKMPKGISHIKISLCYICNQNSVNSKGIDSYGCFSAGVINWNTCILYPESVSTHTITVSTSLKLPTNWKYASSLELQSEDDSSLQFSPTSLTSLIDSPLICGEYVNTTKIKIEGCPDHYIHILSENKSFTMKEEFVENFYRLVKEAKKLFSVFHYQKYDFLVVLSNTIPNIGLEHFANSLNALNQNALTDAWQLKGRSSYLLPHEFVHSWCGKYRIPEGMNAENFHQTKDTRLLWVYEGLTQYLGEVLELRCGFIKLNDYVSRFSHKINTLANIKGRNWRSLEDTATSTYLLREKSKYWSSRRRGQDYYNEGLFVWLHIDLIIRKETQDKKSLDDFCRIFFAKAHENIYGLSFTEDEVIEILQSVCSYSWKDFIDKNIKSPMDTLALEAIEMLGYSHKYNNVPGEYLKELMKQESTVLAIDSLGLELNNQGQILNIIPGMPADIAGFAPTMSIIAINGKKFSNEVLEESLIKSQTNGKIEFLVVHSDNYYPIIVNYQDGPKYFEIFPQEEKQNVLLQIAKETTNEA